MHVSVRSLAVRYRWQIARTMRGDIRLWDLDAVTRRSSGGQHRAPHRVARGPVRDHLDTGLLATAGVHALAYIQVLATVPSYAQELIRLNEIAGRL